MPQLWVSLLLIFSVGLSMDQMLWDAMWYWSVTTPMLVMYIQTFQGVTCQPLDNSV